MKFKRIFVIVMDSVGVGAQEDADLFGDVGTNTFLHTFKASGGLKLPNLDKLGFYNLLPSIESKNTIHPQSYVLTMNEVSSGKDTMTGHWELMGLQTVKPFKTFSEHGFPKALIDELQAKTGHRFVGNIASSGTEIIEKLGAYHLESKEIILYTSADSVLQLAAHEDIVPVQELYRVCQIARDICMKPDYLLGRIIARPFIGSIQTGFKRTSNRHDYALAPGVDTTLDVLKNNGLKTVCIGKISDIFNGQGVTTSQKTVSNRDGMEQTIQLTRTDFKGLCFVNLVEFDSEYGHRRDPIGYGKALEAFDVQLGQLLPLLNEDDLLAITADHGNDPTHTGTDHTRERVPLVLFNQKFTSGTLLPRRETFADLSSTILHNFNLNQPSHHIGKPILTIFK